MRKNFVPFLPGLLMVAHLASAATIIVDPNPIVEAGSITSNVTGANMAGLTVTATYASPMAPFSFTAIWQATGPNSGGVAGPSPFPDEPAFTVSLTGNTIDSLAWKYTSTVLSPLLSLEFDGSDAGIYFDRSHTGPGTPGSGPGNDIMFGPLSPAGIDSSFVVTYSSAVALDGIAPRNDLYAKLTIDFPNSLTGPAEFQPQDFSFTQETVANIVPEPSSWLLALCGLVAAGKFVKRSI